MDEEFSFAKNFIHLNNIAHIALACFTNTKAVMLFTETIFFLHFRYKLVAQLLSG